MHGWKTNEINVLYQVFHYPFNVPCRLQARDPHQRYSAHCPLCMLQCIGIHRNHLCSCMHGIHYCVQGKDVRELRILASSTVYPSLCILCRVSRLALAWCFGQRTAYILGYDQISIHILKWVRYYGFTCLAGHRISILKQFLLISSNRKSKDFKKDLN